MWDIQESEIKSSRLILFAVNEDIKFSRIGRVHGKLGVKVIGSNTREGKSERNLLKFVETSQKNDTVWDWVRERKRLSGEMTANRSWGESLNKKIRYGLLRTVCFSLQLFYLCLLKNVNRWIERRAALNEDARKVAREKWSKSKTFLFTVAILPFFLSIYFHCDICRIRESVGDLVSLMSLERQIGLLLEWMRAVDEQTFIISPCPEQCKRGLSIRFTTMHNADLACVEQPL